MRRSLVIILVSLANYSYCCTCAPQVSVSEAFNGSAWVVIGTIIDHQAILEIDTATYRSMIDQGNNENQAVRASSGGFSQYTLLLSEPTYRGISRSDTIMIRTEMTSFDCGYSFQIGEKYIVYGYNPTREPRAFAPKFAFFWTDNCTRTTPFNEKEKQKINKLANRTSKNRGARNASTQFETLKFRNFNVIVRTPYQMTHVTEQNADYLRSHILKEMETHGFTISSTPDLFVDINIFVKLQAQFSRGSAFGMPIHQVGTLTVRLMDPQENQVLWEGDKTVPLWKMKEGKARKRVGQVVSKIFKDFHPETLSSRIESEPVN